jgi:tryptophan synthase alpha chain
MTQRLDSVFATTQKENRAALITFVMAYDQSREMSAAILSALPAAGADIVELGMPFSDPMADGPVIDAAGKRALKAGATLAGTLELVREFRRSNDITPLILMGYYNPIFQYGTERFARDAKEAGADGVIIVDLPYEESQEFTRYLTASDFAFIRLMAPTTLPERMATIGSDAKGFIYYISMKGITGASLASTQEASLPLALQSLRKYTKAPIAVGFGIKHADQAQEVAQQADGVVVGSAIVKEIAESATTEEALTRVKALVGSLSHAMKRKLAA